MQKIAIDPISRVEGHLKIETLVDQGVVKEASVSGTMFRGFEIFLKGRDPWDAQRLVQRVCGVCPAIHGVAAAQNLDAAFGITHLVPHNGRHIRNLILATNYLQSHILHFYVLAALDFVDLAAVADYTGDDADLKAVRQFLDRGAAAPFLPRYEGDYRLTKEQNVLLARHYVQALRMRALAHEAIALFAGKMPHDVGVVPGGVTAGPTADKILAYVTKIRAIREFIENAYVPDVLTVARAYPDYAEIGKAWRTISPGARSTRTCTWTLAVRQRYFPGGVILDGKLSPADPHKVFEYVKHSWYTEDCARAPAQGQTVPAPEKPEAYSWLKSPRYAGTVCEVGPLARTMIAYTAGNRECRTEVNALLSELKAKPAGAEIGPRPARGARHRGEAPRQDGHGLGARPEAGRAVLRGEQGPGKRRRASVAWTGRAARSDIGSRSRTRRSPATSWWCRRRGIHRPRTTAACRARWNRR